MGSGLPGSHGEGRVEEEHPLRRPGVEAPMGRRLDAEVGLQLLEDVPQRWRLRHARTDGEAEAVGLAGAVVRVLTEDDHLDLLERGEVQCGEHLVVGGVDGVLRPLVSHESLKLGPVGLGQLRPQDRVPVRARGHPPRP